MREAWRVGNDSIGDKRTCRRHARLAISSCHPRFGRPVRCLCSGAVAGLVARPPEPRNHTAKLFAAPTNIPPAQCIEAGHQAWILDHECHELGRISANIEEFEAIVLDKTSEDWMGSKAHTVAISLREYFAQGNKRLCVATRADNVYDDIERWGITARRGEWRLVVIGSIRDFLADLLELFQQQR